MRLWHGQMQCLNQFGRTKPKLIEKKLKQEEVIRLQNEKEKKLKELAERKIKADENRKLQEEEVKKAREIERENLKSMHERRSSVSPEQEK